MINDLSRKEEAILLLRTVCFGSCPVYKFEEDGRTGGVDIMVQSLVERDLLGGEQLDKGVEEIGAVNGASSGIFSKDLCK